MTDRGRIGGLVVRARKGDEAAIAELIDAVQDRLFRFLVLLCGNQELARDLCQDTLIQAIDSLDKLKNPEGFGSWLFKTAKSRFLDHVRRPANAAGPALEEIPETEFDPDGLSKESSLHVQQILASLKEEERLVLLLIDLEGRSYEEAAEVIGITENAVRSRLHRARKVFVEKYETISEARPSIEQKETGEC